LGGPTSKGRGEERGGVGREGEWKGGKGSGKERKGGGGKGHEPPVFGESLRLWL